MEKWLNSTFSRQTYVSLPAEADTMTAHNKERTKAMPVTKKHNYSLRKHNTFGLDVKANQYVSYDSVDELVEVLAEITTSSQPMLHIGSGSNLLFTQDFAGTILHSGIQFIKTIAQHGDEVLVRAGAGIVWDDFCALMAQLNWYGTENLSHIPGEVGAAAVQNIGAYGVEVGSIVHEVETIEVSTGRPRVFQATECHYDYRDSIFKHRHGEYIVTAVVFRLSTTPRVHLDYGALQQLRNNDPVPSTQTIRDAVIAIRQSKLPSPDRLGSAGSFFKNPVISIEAYVGLLRTYPGMPHYPVDERQVKVPAAWLIEQCGMKGHCHGGAAVYERQPLILVNKNHATPSDIVALAEQVKESVYQKFNIQLQPEVNYI